MHMILECHIFEKGQIEARHHVTQFLGQSSSQNSINQSRGRFKRWRMVRPDEEPGHRSVLFEGIQPLRIHGGKIRQSLHDVTSVWNYHCIHNSLIIIYEAYVLWIGIS